MARRARSAALVFLAALLWSSASAVTFPVLMDGFNGTHSTYSRAIRDYLDVLGEETNRTIRCRAQAVYTYNDAKAASAGLEAWFKQEKLKLVDEVKQSGQTLWLAERGNTRVIGHWQDRSNPDVQVYGGALEMCLFTQPILVSGGKWLGRLLLGALIVWLAGLGSGFTKKWGPAA